jgi:hypothetical protein
MLQKQRHFYFLLKARRLGSAWRVLVSVFVTGGEWFWQVSPVGETINEKNPEASRGSFRRDWTKFFKGRLTVFEVNKLDVAFFRIIG